MSDKLTWVQAVALMGGDENRFAQYLKGDAGGDGNHPTFDLYLSVADGMMRSAITSRYTTDSYDAWDSSSIPAYVRQYLFWILLGAATSTDDARAAAITNYAGIAAGWLDDVKSGAKKVPELTEIASTVTNSSGGSIVRVSAPTELTFDRCNASGDFRSRERKI